jgi:hypothetical protein
MVFDGSHGYSTTSIGGASPPSSWVIVRRFQGLFGVQKWHAAVAALPEPRCRHQSARNPGEARVLGPTRVADFWMQIGGHRASFYRGFDPKL